MTNRDPHWTVSRYLLSRLHDAGIRHLFGVPGDYVLDFLDAVVASPIQWVGTCNELNAGYAADGYARLNGLGGAVVTYCVGGLSILNAVAGAYAERVPLVVISGAPGTRRRESGALVHHLVSDYYLQFEIFKKVTTDAAILSHPETAPEEIDRVIRNAVTRKLPVYLEIPADIATARCRPPASQPEPPQVLSDRDSLKDAIEEAATLLHRSADPVVLAGVEVLRFGLGPDVLFLVDRAQVPFATMLSSKCALPEHHPQFAGIYQGGWSAEQVRLRVESSDCLLSLGARMTDVDTGLFSTHLDPRRMIVAGDGNVRIRNHYYHQVDLGDFVRGFSAAVDPRPAPAPSATTQRRARPTFVPDPGRQLTAARLYECLNSFLDEGVILLAEPGDAMCAAQDFDVDEAENFIVQAFYSSVGYCTPAALGAALARPGKRPLVLTGDGAFQMTVQELSTLIRHRCPAIFLLVNNNGYLIERVLHTDGPYNEVGCWEYSEFTVAMGGDGSATGLRVTTEGELDAALRLAASERSKLFLIDAVLDSRDCSAGLRRLGAAFQTK